MIQVRGLSALKGLDHREGVDHTDRLSELWFEWVGSVVCGGWRELGVGGRVV